VTYFDIAAAADLTPWLPPVINHPIRREPAAQLDLDATWLLRHLYFKRPSVSACASNTAPQQVSFLQSPLSSSLRLELNFRRIVFCFVFKSNSLLDSCPWTLHCNNMHQFARRASEHIEHIDKRICRVVGDNDSNLPSLLDSSEPMSAYSIRYFQSSLVLTSRTQQQLVESTCVYGQGSDVQQLRYGRLSAASAMLQLLTPQHVFFVKNCDGKRVLPTGNFLNLQVLELHQLFFPKYKELHSIKILNCLSSYERFLRQSSIVSPAPLPTWLGHTQKTSYFFLVSLGTGKTSVRDFPAFRRKRAGE
jgi:hypothetical protein